MPVSLAEDGLGLGIMWGTERTQQALREAGFAEVTMHDAARLQNCVYVCRGTR
ncbi:MAG: hypothetical protein KGN00_01045 [Chloroflexota bacterium]|nr:hypothetical protein [Chloroflexota bacterium]